MTDVCSECGHTVEQHHPYPFTPSCTLCPCGAFKKVDWTQPCATCGHTLREHNTPGVECIHRDSPDSAFCPCGFFVRSSK